MSPGPLLMLVLCLLLPATAAAQSQYWERDLQDGRSIRVDPSTNRPVVDPGSGRGYQLPDGVHRLEDGTSITVRSGVMVPNAEYREFQREQRYPSRPLESAVGSPCLRLVRKVCGLEGECESHPACAPARQLRRLQEEEAGGVPAEIAFGEGYLPAGVQCREALEDEEFFAACDSVPEDAVHTPCQRLVDKTCGPSGQCGGREACGPARQLLETETRERHAAVNPKAPTFTGGRCRQALGDDEFFSRCAVGEPQRASKPRR